MTDTQKKAAARYFEIISKQIRERVINEGEADGIIESVQALIHVCTSEAYANSFLKIDEEFSKIKMSGNEDS